MNTKNILIIGATSGIAEAVAREYAGNACSFVLVARNVQKLAAIRSDLQARGAPAVHPIVWDATDTGRLTEVLGDAWAALESIDLALVAHGSLPDQERAAIDLPYALEQWRINGESAIACMIALATRFEAQGHGTLAVIGSVAGDRGRPGNFLYGSAKGAVEILASGLRARLFRRGVHVLLIKPGFVATAMTAHLNLPPRLTASAQQVAADIVRAAAAGRDVIYTPRFWVLIMCVIRLIPAPIFKRLSL